MTDKCLRFTNIRPNLTLNFKTYSPIKVVHLNFTLISLVGLTGYTIFLLHSRVKFYQITKVKNKVDMNIKIYFRHIVI